MWGELFTGAVGLERLPNSTAKDTGAMKNAQDIATLHMLPATEGLTPTKRLPETPEEYAERKRRNSHR